MLLFLFIKDNDINKCLFLFYQNMYFFFKSTTKSGQGKNLRNVHGIQKQNFKWCTGIEIKINKASMEMNTSEQFRYKRIRHFCCEPGGKKIFGKNKWQKKNYLDFCKFNKCDNNVAYI